MEPETAREEILVIKEIVLRIEQKLDGYEKRLSRMEWLGGVVTGIFTAAGIYFQELIKKS